MSQVVLLLINTLCLNPQACTTFYVRCYENTIGATYKLDAGQREFLCASEMLDALNIPYKLELEK